MNNKIIIVDNTNKERLRKIIMENETKLLSGLKDKGYEYEIKNNMIGITNIYPGIIVIIKKDLNVYLIKMGTIDGFVLCDNGRTLEKTFEHVDQVLQRLDEWKKIGKEM